MIVSDYDKRQYQLMKERIKYFEDGVITIGSLIDDLEALLGCLQNTNDIWNEAFQHEVGILEVVYAVAIDQGKTAFSQEGEALIKKAIDKLKQLLAEV